MIIIMYFGLILHFLQFDYKSFLRVYLNKSDEPFPQLASLAVRNLRFPITSLLETDESTRIWCFNHGSAYSCIPF